jgi:hypothetical protein
VKSCRREGCPNPVKTKTAVWCKSCALEMRRNYSIAPANKTQLSILSYKRRDKDF